MEDLDKDCLFCKIIRGEASSYTIFENDDVKAFLDLSQVNPGHTLMVPKNILQTFSIIQLLMLSATYNTFQQLQMQLKIRSQNHRYEY
ncbi:HIT domain-containing protein [Lactobacillus sp. R2/2]|nr:HIT domain-containing protein [Lactobacillus sp. R2/2]